MSLFVTVSFIVAVGTLALIAVDWWYEHHE